MGTSPLFDGASNGTSAGMTFTPTDDNPTGQFFVTNNGNVIVNGDPVQLYQSTDGTTNTANATNLGSFVYVGYYDNDGTRNILISDGNTRYALLGYNGTQPVQYTEAGYVECFATGTRILTARGEVAVEDLRVGDLAVTASGARRPITWIGNRSLDGAGKPLAHDQQPVRIRAGAFGHDAAGRPVPARDLRLSPGHPVLVGADENNAGGHLVPAMCLINGTTVARETTAEAVTYWHVELDAHDVLLAEGLAAESYFDMGTRGWFAGADGALADPEFVPAGAHGRCRPVAVAGPVVEAARLRLDAVFCAELAGHCAWDADADLGALAA